MNKLQEKVNKLLEETREIIEENGFYATYEFKLYKKVRQMIQGADWAAAIIEESCPGDDYSILHYTNVLVEYKESLYWVHLGNNSEYKREFLNKKLQYLGANEVESVDGAIGNSFTSGNGPLTIEIKFQDGRKWRHELKKIV
jgi:hypothetical protein